MFLNFLDDLFLQNLALKSPQCIFNGLAFVNLNLRHLFSLSFPFVRSSRTDSQFQTSCSARQSGISSAPPGRHLWDDDIAKYWMQSSLWRPLTSEILPFARRSIVVGAPHHHPFFTILAAAENLCRLRRRVARSGAFIYR